jgi:alginate O-acetyltransferase complex protein AlgI
MIFNSIEFLIFLPIVFLIYWKLLNHNLKAQNFFVLAASYLFYGWWDWRFLSLIIISTLSDFIIGQLLEKQEEKKKRKLLLWASIVVNIGILGFFKYYNFFIENFITAFQSLNIELHYSTLQVILPVGISFYTFQTLSYTIDIYRGKLKSAKDPIAFFAFVSFFPQLVAGPIERASNLLPQFQSSRKFDYKTATDGLRQILWGMFKKVVIADNCAPFVNDIFSQHAELSGSTLLIGAVLFAFQIYGDFSGYSDIAIGTARLFGFNLMRNFSYPYFSRDIAEFWRRWHISLSTWFRDYVYIPLGGSRGTKIQQLKNVFVIFLVSGFWHGANWTFISWGALHALLFIPLLLLNKNRKNLNISGENKVFPSFRELLKILTTFTTVTIAWIFFRAENIAQAFDYIYIIVSSPLSPIDYFTTEDLLLVFSLIGLLVGVEWLSRNEEHGLVVSNQFKNLSGTTKKIGRFAFYYFLVFIILYFCNNQQSFIYFQF